MHCIHYNFLSSKICRTKFTRQMFSYRAFKFHRFYTSFHFGQLCLIRQYLSVSMRQPLLVLEPQHVFCFFVSPKNSIFVHIFKITIRKHLCRYFYWFETMKNIFLIFLNGIFTITNGKFLSKNVSHYLQF